MDVNWTRHREHISGLLDPSDRVLILGSGGWFGQTLRTLVVGLSEVLPHNARTSDQPDWEFRRLIDEFDPTVVANFAFLTPHFARAMPESAYSAANRRIFNRFVYAVSRPSVRFALHTSSGATKSPTSALGREHGVYRTLKREEEEAILSSSTADRCLILRVYSVSGPYVRTPEKYAFSDFVSQGLRGRIQVCSERPTFRRYCSAADLLTVAIDQVSRHGGGVMESGGPLVEMRELASSVAHLTHPSPTLSFTDWTMTEPSEYASDGSSWAQACRDAEWEPTGLERQIREVQSYLAQS